MATVRDISSNAVYVDKANFGGLHHAEAFSDYLVSGDQIGKKNSAPSFTELRDGIFLNAFKGVTTLEQGYFTLHIQHDFKAGQTPTFHIHWTHLEAAPTGNVKWNIDYTLTKGYSAGTFPTTISLSTIQTVEAQFTHHITDDDDMPIVATDDLEPDGVLACRVFRDPTDPADTFTGLAFLVQVDLHYITDKFGTFERNRPYPSGGKF